MKKINSIMLAHGYLQAMIEEGDYCIDATAGRGNDTAFLAQLVGENGKVWAFDIQASAIESTKALLEEKALLSRVQLIHDGHHHMKQYIDEPVKAIMFNFGYLPGGDHTIATGAETSIEAISQGLDLLQPGGLMSLCIYHGGDTGFVERDAILSYLKTLDHHQYTVMLTDFYNRPNHPPIVVNVIKEK